MAVNIGNKASTNKPAPKMGFLKTGKAAIAAQEKEEQDKKARDAAREAGETRRFWMKEDSETQITFLDGMLDDDGIFMNPCYSEHNLYMNGNWRNWFPCVAESEPCPLCELAEDRNNKVSRANLVTLFTVIDHSSFESNGKVYKDQIKLYVAKHDTMKMLLKHAQKNGGLVGCTFDVSRTGENSANVGNSFILDQKNDLADIVATFQAPDKPIAPLDYEKVIHYYTAAELGGMGIKGAPSFGAGAASSGEAKSATPSASQLAQEL